MGNILAAPKPPVEHRGETLIGALAQPVHDRGVVAIRECLDHADQVKVISQCRAQQKVVYR